MANCLWFHTHRRRCFFCAHVGASEAYSATVCLRHQLLISLRLLILLARHGRFVGLWKVVKVKW